MSLKTITEDELNKYLNKLKGGKSHGVDNIDSLIDGVSCWMRSNNIERLQTFFIEEEAC